MTISLFPVVHESETEHFAPRGFTSPLTFLVPTHDTITEHRPNAEPTSTGPGALLYLDGAHALPPQVGALGNYFANITDLNGGFYAALLNTNPGRQGFTLGALRWTLNGHNTSSIAGPLSDPAIPYLIDPLGRVIDGREIQIGRDDLGVLMHYVPSPRADPKSFQMQLFGPTYHLGRKYVGRNNEQPNLITNGNFDIDLSDWTPFTLATATWSASPFEREPGAVVLTSALAGDCYLHQTVDVPSLPYATFVWLSAWVYVDAGVSVQNLSTSGRGLWSVWRVGGTVVWQQGVSPNWRAAGTWQRVQTKVFVPAFQAQTMQVRLYCPKGLVRWDDVTAYREERLPCSGTPSDIIACLVDHAQDAGLGKSFVNVHVDNSRGEGAVLINRFYKYSEAANVHSANGEMASLQGGVDWLCEIGVPDTNTRTIFTMDRTGYDDPDRVHLVWGDNLNGWQWVWNPDKRADIVRVQGRGSGDMVTEALYNDPDSDLGWEFVRRASIEGSEHPQDQANGLGAQYKRPLTIVAQVRRTPDFDVAGHLKTAALGGGLLPGRLVDVDLDEGPIHVHEPFKILDTTFTPEREIAELQLISVSQLDTD